MSDPTDKELDDYLKGGSPVSQRYREMEADAVPPHLDHRVLAQAREAVTRRRAVRSRAWMRWTAPLALAASAVMVVSIVIQSGVQKETVLTADQVTADVAAERGKAEAEERLELRSMLKPQADAVEQSPVPAAEAPVPLPRVKAEATAAPQPASPEQIASSAKRMRAERQDSAASVIAVDPGFAAATEAKAPAFSTPAPAPVAAAAPPPSTAIQQTTSTRPAGRSSDEQSREHDLSEVVVTGSLRRAPPTAGPRNSVPTRSMSGAAAAEPGFTEARAQADPEVWLADIRQLRKDGKTAEADLEWERFRVAFPEYVVSDNDVARKKQ